MLDCVDECAFDPMKSKRGDCGCFVPDTDSDGDGIADCRDSCPSDVTKTFPDICGCGVSDVDSDFDGLPDCIDQCPFDSDGDGLDDCIDNCPFIPGVVFFDGVLDGCPIPEPIGPDTGTNPSNPKEEVDSISTNLPEPTGAKTKKAYLKSTGKLIKILKKQGGQLTLNKGSVKSFQKKLLKLKRKLRRAKGGKVKSFSKKIKKLIDKLGAALI